MGLVFIAILVLGWDFPLLGFFIPLCMLLGVAIGIGRGRKWCDWYCPRGSFYDAIIGNFSPKKNIPPVLKSLYFRLGLLVFLMLIMVFNLVLRWPNPYRTGAFFITLLTTTTALGVILALTIHARAWCTVCPVGTIINLTARNKKPLKIDSELCVECKLCAKACPVQIKPFKFKGEGIQVVKDKDCLQCGSCVAVCPKSALTFWGRSLRYHSLAH